MAWLRAGNYAVLSDMLPDRMDQIAVTLGVLEAAYEESGDLAFAETAKRLEQVKDDLAEIDPRRDRDLEEDMGL
ncbi:hypothetical protein [Cognatishimia sp. MH4019]|uniref:hypothetical protein n=1 Tax=Cognatishimia sp. MH4019 TaxID=2854030 RepID=UPI001CD66B3E|nr:hypothetical protein [Cognatishimia sp. MH4019]